jgi:hypothetical protein
VWWLEGARHVKEGEGNFNQVSDAECLDLCYGLFSALEGTMCTAFLHCISVLVRRCGGEEEGALDRVGQNVPE